MDEPKSPAWAMIPLATELNQIISIGGNPMNRFLQAVTFGALAMTAIAPTQAATIYTDRAAFLAAITGAVVEDFEENALGGFTSQPGATFSGSNFSITSSSSAGLFTVDPGFDPFYVWGSGDVLDFESGIGAISVLPGVTAFGFNFGNPALESSPGGTISINGTAYAQTVQPIFGFFGLVASAGEAPFGTTTINFNGGLGILDDFVTGSALAVGAVPEPASWAMMIIGFGLAGGAMRRRRVTTRVVFG